MVGWALFSISTATNPQRVRFTITGSGLQTSLDRIVLNFLNSLGHNLVRPNGFKNKYSSYLRACQSESLQAHLSAELLSNKWSSWFVLFCSFKENQITLCLSYYQKTYLTACAGHNLPTQHKLETPGKSSPQLRIVFITLTVGIVSWLLMDRVGPSQLWLVSSMGIRSWACGKWGTWVWRETLRALSSMDPLWCHFFLGPLWATSLPTWHHRSEALMSGITCGFGCPR